MGRPVFGGRYMVKKFVILLVLVLFLAPVAEAQGIRIGIGPFGGANIPIAQEDQKTGNAYGVKARIGLLSFIVAEPHVTLAKWNAPDPVRGIDLGIEGSKINSYGIDAVIGGLPGLPGLKPFGFVGAAIYTVKNDDTAYDESKMGFSAGLGFAIGLTPKFDLDVRGKAVVAPQEEGSKKAVFVLGGLTYYFNVGQ